MLDGLRQGLVSHLLTSAVSSSIAAVAGTSSTIEPDFADVLDVRPAERTVVAALRSCRAMYLTMLPAGSRKKPDTTTSSWSRPVAAVQERWSRRGRAWRPAPLSSSRGRLASSCCWCGTRARTGSAAERRKVLRARGLASIAARRSSGMVAALRCGSARRPRPSGRRPWPHPPAAGRAASCARRRSAARRGRG